MLRDATVVSPLLASPLLAASTLTGNRLRNPKGEDLGRVHEILLDTEVNTIVYVVVSLDGLLGLGDEPFAVPWDAMAIDVDERSFILDLAREPLEPAGGLDSDRWLMSADR